MSFVYVNGAIVVAGEARVSVRDRGFLYGDGLFETFMMRDGKTVGGGEHLTRLYASCKFLKITPRMTKEEMLAAVKELAERNELTSASVRIAVSRGVHAKAVDGMDIDEATVVIEARPLAPYPDELYRDGAAAVVSNYTVSVGDPLRRHKTANYLLNILARRQAHAAGALEAIFFNNEGYLAECATSNIFFVRDGVVHTPHVNANILPGITRSTVVDICKRENITVYEELYKREELFKADEVFLTNSLMGVMPVVKIDGIRIGTGEVGLFTKKVMDIYAQFIEAFEG